VGRIEPNCEFKCPSGITEEVKKYRNENLGIILELPNDWEVYNFDNNKDMIYLLSSDFPYDPLDIKNENIEGFISVSILKCEELGSGEIIPCEPFERTVANSKIDLTEIKESFLVVDGREGMVIEGTSSMISNVGYRKYVFFKQGNYTLRFTIYNEATLEVFSDIVDSLKFIR
jgi:hypothetical protein